MRASNKSAKRRPHKDLAEAPALPAADGAVITPWRYPAQPTGFYRRTGKRCLDLVVGLTLLGVLLPLMAAVSVAVFVSSGLPVLYCSERVGRHGSAIKVWKFRTMVRNADNSCEHGRIRHELTVGLCEPFAGKDIVVGDDARSLGLVDEECGVGPVHGRHCPAHTIRGASAQGRAGDEQP
jgi:lipopolysaccharide/colanic/teichoic acid biosynthesis glycosyltransferase